MNDIKVGKKLPEELRENLPEGLTGMLTEEITVILKMEDITEEDVAVFNSSNINIDLLEINSYKDVIGELYAFSILVDGLIDNSEVMIDFRVEDIEKLMPKKFNKGDGIKVTFLLVNEEDILLANRKFKLSNNFSNIVSEKAYGQNNIKLKAQDDDTDYILLAFQKLFENEPEKNLKLYSVGKCEIKK